MCQYRPEWRSTLMQSTLPSSAPNQHSLLSFHIPMNTEVNVCVYQEAPRCVGGVGGVRVGGVRVGGVGVGGGWVEWRGYNVEWASCD